MACYQEKDRPGKPWRYEFEISKKRFSGYCVDPVTGAAAKSKTDAKRILEQIRARHRAPAEHGLTSAPGNYSLGEAFALYATKASRHSNWPDVQGYIKEALAFFGERSPAASIDDAAAWRWINKLEATPVSVWVGGPNRELAQAKAETHRETARKRSVSVIIHRVNVLRAALLMAHRSRDPLSKLPLIPHPPKLAQGLKPPKRKPRPISDQNLERLVAFCRTQKSPTWGRDYTAHHLADALMLCRHMGFRHAEVFGLTLHHARDFETLRGIWLSAEETKGDSDALVRANPTAMEILRRLVAQARERGTQHLITLPKLERHGPSRRKGWTSMTWVPVKRPKKAFATALKACGIVNRFHDSRASFVTALARAGASGPVTKKAARHKSFTTTERYLDIVDQDVNAAVDAIAAMSGPTPNPTPNPTQNPTQAKTPRTPRSVSRPKLRVVSAR